MMVLSENKPLNVRMVDYLKIKYGDTLKSHYKRYSATPTNDKGVSEKHASWVCWRFMRTFHPEIGKETVSKYLKAAGCSVVKFKTKGGNR